MANDSFTQQALGAEPQFLNRVRAQLISQAFAVLAESTGTPNHAIRVVYARAVLNDSLREANRVVLILPMRTNLFAATTSYDFMQGKVVTAATDASILSQIATDWDILAGV